MQHQLSRSTIEQSLRFVEWLPLKLQEHCVMRKLWFVLPVLAVTAVVAAYLLKPAATVADPNKTEPARPATISPTASQLPIAQVVLFSSGVGYFQREGTVEGSTRIDLSFQA